MGIAGGPLLTRYGVVSDEIDDDPEVAFGVARQWDMEAVDLNSVWGKPITQCDDTEVAALGRTLGAHHMRTYMVAGSSFKFLPAGADIAPDMAVLERSLQIARALGAPCARVHAFGWPGPQRRRPGGGEIPADVMPAIVAGLRAACELAGRYGLVLGLENVRASYANCGRNAAAVCAAVGDPRLRVVWDPANAFVSGEDAPYPDGYEACREWIDHVHVKDARLAADGTTAWECVGRGAVDWVGQLRALRADGYAGLLCVETHWSPEGRTGQQATRVTFDGMLAARERAAGA